MILWTPGETYTLKQSVIANPVESCGYLEVRGAPRAHTTAEGCVVCCVVQIAMCCRRTCVFNTCGVHAYCVVCTRSNMRAHPRYQMCALRVGWLVKLASGCKHECFKPAKRCYCTLRVAVTGVKRNINVQSDLDFDFDCNLNFDVDFGFGLFYWLGPLFLYWPWALLVLLVLAPIYNKRALVFNASLYL